MLKEKAGIERTLKKLDVLEEAIDEAATLIEMGDEEGDAETVAEGEEAMRAIAPDMRQAEIEQMMSEEMDINDAVLEINSGAGGIDACDWAAMLKRMYLGWATKAGYKAKVVGEQPHEDAGIKSVQIEVQGPYAYGYLKSEIGVHRLVRISPFDAQARRHTAVASVDVTPESDDDIEIEVAEPSNRTKRLFVRTSCFKKDHVA